MKLTSINKLQFPFMKKHLLLLVLLFVCVTTYSQEIKFEHLGLESGLPVSWIRSICRDRMGFVWIGTNSGFCRYDGYQIRSYFNKNRDTASLSSNQINKVKALPDGRIIIATIGGGISIFDPKKEKFRNFFYSKGDQSEKNNQTGFENIYDIEIDRNNTVWLATEQGIVSFDPTNLICKKIIKPFPSNENKNNSFRALRFTKDGSLWAASPFYGLVNIETNTGKILDRIRFSQMKQSIKEGGTFQCMLHIEFDDSGTLWIATEGLGLWIYKNKALKNVLALEVNNKPEMAKYFNKGISFSNKKMWVGFDGFGIGLFDTQTYKAEFITPHQEDQNGLNSATIQDIFADKSGIVWVQTYDGGLNIFNPERFKFSSIKPNGTKTKGLSNRSIWSFLEDSNGKIWIGTDGGGIDILDPKNERANFNYLTSNLLNSNSISSNVIKDIKQTRDGNYWFGTYLGGICKYEPKNKKFSKWLPTIPTDPKSPATNLVWSILEDSYGTMWLSCLGNGLDTLDRKKEIFYHFTGKDNERRFTNGAAYVLYEDKKRTVWACTDGGGLYYYTRSKLKFQKYIHSSDSTSLPSNRVFGVFDDADGNFWVGTNSGLSLLDRKTGKFTILKLVDEVIQPVVYCILQDKAKHLWISSNQGLFCYDIKTKRIDHYDKSDGLQGNEYKYGSSLMTKDGKIYFGGSEGYDSFYPENIKKNKHKPNVYLSEILLFNKPIKPNDGSGITSTTAEYAKKLVFNHNQSVITIRYTAINFTNSGKNQYAYRLVGFEKEWNYVGTKREANYTNLDPGSYTFEVKASNNDGLWNETPLQIEIIIVPPFWKTWWFRMLVVLALVSSSVGYYLNRINNFKKRQRFLEQKVEERTADLKEANTTLEMKHEEILQQQEEILSQRDELEKKNGQLEIKQVEISTALQNIQTISDFGQKITSLLDVEKISRMTYEYIGSFMEICSFGIGFYHESMQIIEFSNFIEEGKSLPPFYTGQGNPDNYLIRLLNAKSEAVVNELTNEYADFIQAFGKRKSYIVPQSLMFFPLNVDNKLIGMMVVTSMYPDAFTDVTRNNIKALASYIAIADDNASAYKQINLKNAAINGSIRYGLTIQKAMQISEDGLKQYFDSFILSKPKDIVSGDFYWFSYQKNNLYDEDSKYLYNNIYIAVVDCTGHGVPGAFMSMIGNRLLNSIVNEKKILEPSKILDELNIEVMNALQQSVTDNNDGMDISLAVIQQPEDSRIDRRKVIFAGAKLPLVYYSKASNELQILRGDRQSIGGMKLRKEKTEYMQHEVLLKIDDMIYMSSDGMKDQCDAERKRFGSARLYKLLGDNANEALSVQKQRLEYELLSFMAGVEQRDDITIVGLKL